MRQWKTGVKIVLAAVLAFQFSGCGAILYPERRGQKVGTIDAGVAVMDGVLLLFFIVPGVIAYAVDFSTGAIYLPSGKRHAQGPEQPMRVVHMDPARMNLDSIHAAVAKETGIPAAVLARTAPQVQALNSVDEIPARLTETVR